MGMSRSHVYTNIRVWLFAHICTCIYIQVDLFVYIYAVVYICTGNVKNVSPERAYIIYSENYIYICVYVCTYGCVYVCMYVYNIIYSENCILIYYIIYIYVCMYIFTYNVHIVKTKSTNVNIYTVRLSENRKTTYNCTQSCMCVCVYMLFCIQI